MPNWAMLEELTLGQLSHLYKGLRFDSDKKAIARKLDLAFPLLESWLHTLTVIRNYCAHHSRLWNRELGIKPAKPRRRTFSWPAYLQHEQLHTRIAAVLAMLHHLMLQVAPHASWSQRLFDLFKEFPGVPLEPMGLPANWKDDLFWDAA